MFGSEKHRYLWAVGAVSALVAGCGGSSSGGPKLAEMDKAWVDEALVRVEDMVPGCVTEEAVLPVAALMKSITEAEELVTLVSTKAVSADSSSTKSTSAPRSIAIPGPCGGTVTVDRTHASGSDTFEMTFEGYCLTLPATLLRAVRSVDGAGARAAADEKLYLEGMVKSVQVGTPSNSGPVVSELRSSFKNLALTHGDERTLVSMDSAKTIYGRPSTWSPFYPTVTDPDKFSIKKITMNFETRGTVDELRNLSGTRWGATGAASVDIKAGSYVRGDTGEIFNIATSADQPVVVNIDQAKWVSGEVDLLGAKGSSITIGPAATAGSYSVVRDGAPAGSADCGAGQVPFEHLVDLLVDELPLY